MGIPAHDPVLIFAIVMTSVLIAPILAEKAKLPGIVGLIFFGIILGPYVSNVLERDKTIELLGTIGLLYIMFQAGLEINLEEVRKNKHHSLVFGFLTFFIPLSLGTAAGYYILNMNLPASILLATMFSSHTLLTFPIVSRFGLGKKRSATATIGGTILTDTMAFIILAVIIASNSGDLNLPFWLKLLSFSALYTAIVIIILPRITSWFFRHFFTDSGVEEYVFVITALFICAHFSHMIGLEPIIGAFLAGLTLNPLIPEKSILMSRIQFVGSSLFIPFFLISVGMLIDPLVLFTNIDAAVVTIVMVAIALLSKDLAARIFCKIVSFDKIERGLMFGMSVNQAAATLAAVLIGYRVGIFEEAILTGTIMMIVVTSFVGSLFTQKYAKKMALAAEKPSDFASDKTSLDRILIPLANPQTVNSLMDLALLLQSQASHEPLYPLHVVTEGNDIEAKLITGESILAKASVRASARHKNAIPLNKIGINVPATILRAIDEQRVSKVVLGWHTTTGSHGTFYRAVTQQFVKRCSEMIFISKLIKPLSLNKRIVFIIPPDIDKQNGFWDTMKSLKKLGSSISAEWYIVSEKNTFEQVRELFSKGKGDLQHLPVQNWKNLPSDLAQEIKPTDMLVQLLARRGDLAWKLHFEHLPNLLAKQFTDSNLLIVYPYLNLNDFSYDLDKTVNNSKFMNLIPAENFFLNVQEADPQIVLDKIFAINFPEIKQVISRQVAAVIHEYPLELTDEVVLIHTKTALLEKYQIFISANKAGFHFEKLENHYKMMIVLLSPESKSSQSHLNMLAQISKVVTSDHFIENMLTSDSYQELLACSEPECNPEINVNME